MGCTPGYTFTGSDCVAVCGDGEVVGGEQCDDGNGVGGDGCDGVCNAEGNYTCFGTQPSVCSYNQPLTVTLTSTQKLLTSNTLVFNVKIGPAIPALNTVNFSQFFSINLTNTNLSYSYDGNGNLVITADYPTSIQG